MNYQRVAFMIARHHKLNRIKIMDKIFVEYGVKKEIKEALDVSYPTIRKALNGDVDTSLAKRIRKAAMNKGGYEIIKK